MWDLSAIQTTGVMIVFASALALLARRTNIPHIVIYIISGLMLGQLEQLTGGPTFAKDDAVVHTISEIGIALLLFLVGLELSLDKIRDVGKVAVIAGLGQVVFTAIFGTLFALALGFSMTESLVLGTALTFSSTVVVVKLLGHKKHLDSMYGRIAVGIFLVQDLVVIVVLTVMAGIFDGGELEAEGIIWGLSKAFFGMSVLLVLTLAVSKWALSKLMAWASASTEMLLIWSLCWCFLLVVTADSFGLSAEIGAFLAGLGLARLPLSRGLKQRVHPLMNFFIAIFFISLGMQMDLSAAMEIWWPGLVLSLFVLIGNPLIFMWIIVRGGYGERTSFMTSVTVAQISEFSFVFAALSFKSGLIGEPVLAVVTMVGLVTIIASSYMILHNEKLYVWARAAGLLKLFRAANGDDEMSTSASLTDHFVVVGMNDMGREIAMRLLESKKRVVAIDSDPRKLEGLPCTTLVGSADYLSTLEDASYHNAKLVISALRIEDTNNALAYHCAQARVPVAIHGFDRSVIPELRRLKVDHIIDSKKAWLRAAKQQLKEYGVPLS